jgi:hypothetical protein
VAILCRVQVTLRWRCLDKDAWQQTPMKRASAGPPLFSASITAHLRCEPWDGTAPAALLQVTLTCTLLAVCSRIDLQSAEACCALFSLEACRQCGLHSQALLQQSDLGAMANGQVVVTEENGGTSTSEERRVAVFDPAAPQHSSAGGSGAGGRKKVISGSKHTPAAGEVHLFRDDVTPHQSLGMVGLPVCSWHMGAATRGCPLVLCSVSAGSAAAQQQRDRRLDRRFCAASIRARIGGAPQTTSCCGNAQCRCRTCRRGSEGLTAQAATRA